MIDSLSQHYQGSVVSSSVYSLESPMAVVAGDINPGENVAVEM